MKLRPQRRGPKRAPRRPARATRATVSRSRGAQRPGVPLGRRIGARLPSLGRIGAVLAAAVSIAALVALLNGPWLRVTSVTFAGNHYTDAADLERPLVEQRGRSVLSVDTDSLRHRIERLPAVADVTVEATVFGSIAATVVEREVAFVWQTASRRYLGSADGTIFAAISADEALPADLAALPFIRDERFVARLVSVGDVIPDGVLETALRVVAIDPVALGSTSPHLGLRLDDEFGFRLVSASPAWEIALGPYGTEPTETPAEAEARLDRQVAAVRTLFRQQPEEGIGWVDVRNPGKVYFRAKG